jgi:hypothetical protein
VLPALHTPVLSPICAALEDVMEMCDKPRINWEAQDLPREWGRFENHCTFTFNGPLKGKSEPEKVNYLMGFVGDKGREVYLTFTWPEVPDGLTPAQETLAGVQKQFQEYVAPKKNHIRATVEFNRRRQDAGEFDSFVTALRLLVKDCGYEQLQDRMIRDAIVMRSHHIEVMERCLDEGDDSHWQDLSALAKRWKLAEKA